MQEAVAAREEGVGWPGRTHGRLRMLTHSPISGDSGTSGPQAAPGPLGQSESPWAWPGGAGLQWADLGEQTSPAPGLCPSQLAKHPGYPASWPGPRLTLSSAAAAGPRVDRAGLGVPRAEGAASTLPPPSLACSASSRRRRRERPSLQCALPQHCACLTPSRLWLGRPSPAARPGKRAPPPPALEP